MVWQHCVGQNLSGGFSIIYYYYLRKDAAYKPCNHAGISCINTSISINMSVEECLNYSLLELARMTVLMAGAHTHIGLYKQKCTHTKTNQMHGQMHVMFREEVTSEYGKKTLPEVRDF